MTDPATLLSELRKRNVRLWIEGERLKCSAPAGMLGAEIREALMNQKDEVMACLRQAESFKSLPKSIAPFNFKGDKEPVFFLSGDRDNLFYTASLAQSLGPEQPVLVVQPPGYDGDAPLDTVEALARYQIEQIRRYQPQGPYLIAGHCMGGPIAFEAAQQLNAAGEQVALLALIASRFPSRSWPRPTKICRLMKHASALTSGTPAERWQYFMSKLQQGFRKQEINTEVSPSVPPTANKRVLDSSFVALRSYRPRHYAGQVDLFFTSYEWFDFRKWRTVAGTLRKHNFDFDVHELRLGPHVPVLAKALKTRIDDVAACVSARST